MTTENVNSPFGERLAGYIRLLIASLTRFLMTLYWGTQSERIPPITDNILKQPAVEVARKIRNKEITSVEVLEACIKRIKETKAALNCVVANRFEEAYKEARAADELIRSGVKTSQQLQEEKPFLGVPFTTKDSISVAGLPLTAGIVDRKNTIATEDADVIRRLKEAGAIIIAITNVPEQCMWCESHNHVYGRTNNPYNTTKHVGGSSGGEGCIQAAGGSIFGIGSDIGGSIRMPAFFNGIFGHKPTREVVSNHGQVPASTTYVQDLLLGLGPMTRYAVDLKPIMKIISGDNASKLNLDKPVDISKIKLYYQFDCKHPLTDRVDEEIVDAMKKAVEYFKVQHKVAGEEKHISKLRESGKIWSDNMKSPRSFAKEAIGTESFFAIVWEIIKNFFGLSKHTFCILLFSLMDREEVPLESEQFKSAIKEREEFEDIFKEMLGENGVFFYPTHPTATVYHNETIVKFYNFTYTAAINALGMPSTAIPLGLNKEGLPIGLQVVSNYNNDRLCFAVAEELEKAFGGWIEPQNA